MRIFGKKILYPPVVREGVKFFYHSLKFLKFFNATWGGGGNKNVFFLKGDPNVEIIIPNLPLIPLNSCNQMQ